MNIFYLDKDPILAARYHCDKHVVKMILESAQLLSTAHRVLDGEEGVKLSSNGRKLKTWILPDYREEILYKATHVNHPSAKWVRESRPNYIWLTDLADALLYEYANRYARGHACIGILNDLQWFLPDNLPDGEFSEPPQAMPEYCQVPGDSVQAYRNYYINEKKDIAEWRYSAIPEWFTR